MEKMSQGIARGPMEFAISLRGISVLWILEEQFLYFALNLSCRIFRQVFINPGL
jgi:hypothetical protein